MTPPSFWSEKDAFYSFLESMKETAIINIKYWLTHIYKLILYPGFQKTEQPSSPLSNYRISQDEIYILTK